MKNYVTKEGVPYLVYDWDEIDATTISDHIAGSTFFDAHYAYAKEKMIKNEKIKKAETKRTDYLARCNAKFNPMQYNHSYYCKLVAAVKAAEAKKHNYISSIAYGFDIEATRVVDTAETQVDDVIKKEIIDARSYMYHWQITINDLIICGRKWDQFEHVIQLSGECINKELHKAMNRAKKKYTKKNHPYVIIWDANLPYEFQFIKDRLCWDKVFAKDTRKALTASFVFDKSDPNERSFMKFQDCLQISNSNLENLAEDYCTTHKRKGDLDYNVPRNSMTVLTDEELTYCYDDVAILSEWHKYFYNTYSQKHYAPMTATGILRHEVKSRQTIDDLNAVYSMFPSDEEYQYVMNWVFKGGYAHANLGNVNLEFDDEIYSWDITSSYPYVMLHNVFAMESFYHYQPLEDVLNQLADDPDALHYFIESQQGKVMFYAEVEIMMPEAVTNNTYISKSKCLNKDEIKKYEKIRSKVDNFPMTILDNGRIKRTLRTVTAETDVDILTLLEMYSYDEIHFSHVMMCTELRTLPKYVTEPIETAYEEKCRLKKEGKTDTIEYKVAKAKVNAGYGMMCTRLVEDEIEYNQETRRWGLAETKQKNKMKQLFLNPMWGVWVTAYARRRLMQMVIKAGDNTVVCDTDSIYAKKSDELMQYIDDENNRVLAQNATRFSNPLFDDLGCWDKQSVDDNGNFVPYERFATMGAKRYILFGWNEGKYKWKQTIAGLPKNVIFDFVDKYNAEPDKKKVDPIHAYNNKETIDPMEVFLGLKGFEMTEEDAKKNTTIYHDDPHEDYVTDEQGHTELMRELSSISIVPITFRMTIAEEFQTAIYWLMANVAKAKTERRVI